MKNIAHTHQLIYLRCYIARLHRWDLLL